ncbi:hypothetical protein [Rodentibacter pneumotropicus]|uniref:hypothetical protein n=1 Tax=Rodentibacter pneumotropicus TaxID=758 RepID=UPI00037B3BCF|nr:hypothetical protein [Rodentibacter pneumotropicus]
MSKFDLEQALQGAPVRLNNGLKAYIFADVSNIAINEPYPLMGGYGYTVQSFYDGSTHHRFEDCRWTKDGKCDRLNALGSIAGMWEE